MSKLRPAVEVSASTPVENPERLSPLLWPLAAYLAVGTLLLFAVAQLDALAAYISPWDAKANRWHEGSAGWMALFPVTVPVLIVVGVVRLTTAIPLRGLELAVRVAYRIGAAFARAWEAVRAAMRRMRAAMQAMLQDAMRAVRRAADQTVRRVRAALARVTRTQRPR